jgi:hypothetical protein
MEILHVVNVQVDVILQQLLVNVFHVMQVNIVHQLVQVDAKHVVLVNML